MSEEREPYGNLEDLDLMVQEYLDVKKKHEFNSWQLADLALEARNKFGDLKAFTKKTGENPGTLKVYANLAESYPTVNRLLLAPFKHHMVVMNHDRRYELLQKAIDNKWSAERLRQEAYPPKEKPVKDTPLQQPPPPPAQPERHIPSWEIPDPPDVLGEAFKPFIEVYNQLYVSNSLPESMPEAIVLLFGVSDKWRLMFVEGFGYQMINLKAHNYMEEGPSRILGE